MHKRKCGYLMQLSIVTLNAPLLARQKQLNIIPEPLDLKRLLFLSDSIYTKSVICSKGPKVHWAATGTGHFMNN